jgi:hypothetical protein
VPVLPMFADFSAVRLFRQIARGQQDLLPITVDGGGEAIQACPRR